MYLPHFWNLKRESNLDLDVGSILYLENIQKGRFAQEKKIFPCFYRLFIQHHLRATDKIPRADRNGIFSSVAEYFSSALPNPRSALIHKKK